MCHALLLNRAFALQCWVSLASFLLAHQKFRFMKLSHQTPIVHFILRFSMKLKFEMSCSRIPRNVLNLWHRT
jgi:hypothetical protein